MDTARTGRRHFPGWLGAALLIMVIGVAAPVAADEIGRFLSLARLSEDEAAATRGRVVEDVGGNSVQLVRLPIGFKLLDREERRSLLRLRLPVSFGLHDLSATLDGEIPLSASVSTVSFMPGVELVYPLSEDWTLKPFVELGAGFDLSASGNEAFLLRTGLASVARFPQRSFVWSVGASVDYENGFFEGVDASIDPFWRADLGVDALFPLKTASRGRQLDMSVYAMHRRFLPSATFEGVNAEISEVDYRNEVGLTLGSDPRWRVMGWNVPRLGVAYRWGQGFSSWRLNFGFPF